MDPQLAASGYSSDDLARINNSLTAVSQDPVTGSPAAVSHTNARPSESSSRRENPRPITDSDNLEKCKQAQLDLESEKKLHNQARIDLKKKEQELKDLRRRAKADLDGKDQELSELYQKDQELDHLYRQATADLNRKDQELDELLQKKDQELDDLRKRWKQAISELNKFMAQDQRFYQVTDQEFTQKATQLRFNIRNFADQQFGGKLIDTRGLHPFWQLIEGYFEISYDSFEACMKDPSRRSMIVGAFLWAVLTKDVFGNFCWAGTSVSSAMSRLGQVLEPVKNESLASGLEAKRKFQMWRANTTTLLLDSKELEQRDNHGAPRRLNEKVESICESLRLFSKSRDKDLIDQLFRIVNEALNLDKLISKQVAEVIWDSDLHKDSGQFNQGLMEMWRGKKQTGDSENVWLVSAPGMIKRGKSTGEDFNVENILLKMEVAWEPNIEYTGESHKTIDYTGEGYKKNVQNIRNFLHNKVFH